MKNYYGFRFTRFRSFCPCPTCQSSVFRSSWKQRFPLLFLHDLQRCIRSDCSDRTRSYSAFSFLSEGIAGESGGTRMEGRKKEMADGELRVTRGAGHYDTIYTDFGRHQFGITAREMRDTTSKTARHARRAAIFNAPDTTAISWSACSASYISATPSN